MIKLIRTGLYTAPEVFTQISHCCFISLLVSGIESFHVYFPGGQDGGEVENQSLLIQPPGYKSDFVFNESRENYVSLCMVEGLRWNAQQRRLFLQIQDSEFEIPHFFKLTPEQLTRLREVFQRCVRLTQSSLAADLAAAELLMTGVLAEFLNPFHLRKADAPPPRLEAFRQLIDQDREFKYSLVELAGKIKTTPVHLRRLFLQYYHMTPAEYQARLRFNRIQTLLGDSRLCLKEIASAVGMKHVTHLYRFIRQRCGLTPLQLQRNLKIG